MASGVSYLSVDQKGRATLPEEVRASLGLRPGDFVLLCALRPSCRATNCGSIIPSCRIACARRKPTSPKGGRQ